MRGTTATNHATNGELHLRSFSQDVGFAREICVGRYEKSVSLCKRSLCANHGLNLDRHEAGLVRLLCGLRGGGCATGHLDKAILRHVREFHSVNNKYITANLQNEAIKQDQEANAGSKNKQSQRMAEANKAQEVLVNFLEAE